MGKHGGQQDSTEAALQAKADEFDAYQAQIDARVEANQTNYPALQDYEQQRDKK